MIAVSKYIQRSPIKFLYLAALITALPQKSQAFVYDTDEKMFFHSETMWQDDAGNDMALCVLRKRYHVMWVGIWAVRASNKRSARRAELTSHIPEKVRGPLAFCLQAALSDGTADDSELTAISDALKQVYSQRLTVAQLRELVDNTDMDMSAPEVDAFLLSGSTEEKHQALRLLVMVTAADGNLDQAEMKFAVEAAAKLGFTQADVAAIYQSMSGNAGPAA